MAASATRRSAPSASAATMARAASRSVVGQASGQRIGPSPYSAARASQSAIPAPRRSVNPQEPCPRALKSAPAATGRQDASGSNASIRSAASQEYGDMAPKKSELLITARSSQPLSIVGASTCAGSGQPDSSPSARSRR